MNMEWVKCLRGIEKRSEERSEMYGEGLFLFSIDIGVFLRYVFKRLVTEIENHCIYNFASLI